MFRFLLIGALVLCCAAPSWAATDETLACPGCCSSHGGITNRCNASNGRVICVDGTTSPTCLCSSCGVPTQPTCTNGQVWNGFVCVCPPGQSYVGGRCIVDQPPAIVPQTGWWWNPNQSGRGFFIQQSGTTLGIAGFIYDSAGRPIWFISTGQRSGNTMTASMQTFRNGQTLNGDYKPPEPGPSLGTLTVSFLSATQATLSWPAGITSIQRGAFGSGTNALPNVTGWWMAASEGGRGYSLEVQGNTVFIAGYMYSETGAPVWYTAAGVYALGRVDSAWQRFDAGQPLPGAYRAPTLVDPNVGRLLIEFDTADTAWMMLPTGRRIRLGRFIF